MRKVRIEVQLDDNKMAKIVEKEGFENSLTGVLEFIGLLENIKHKELEKLKTFAREDVGEI